MEGYDIERGGKPIINFYKIITPSILVIFLRANGLKEILARGETTLLYVVSPVALAQ